MPEIKEERTAFVIIKCGDGGYLVQPKEFNMNAPPYAFACSTLEEALNYIRAEFEGVAA